MNSEQFPIFFNGNFWVEAKVGFYNYGARIKEKQIRGFRTLTEPVVYVVGYHDFELAETRLAGLNEEQMDLILRREMGIVKSYFVTDSVIRALWNKEKRVSRKEGVVYCMLKSKFFDSIIHNTPFRRNRQRFTPSRYYRLTRSKLVLQPSGSSQYGVILDRERDEATTEYQEKEIS